MASQLTTTSCGSVQQGLSAAGGVHGFDKLRSAADKRYSLERMPNLADFVLAIAWLVLLFFFLPMFQLARVITDALVGHQDKTTTLRKATFAVTIVFVYLAFLVLARGMMQLARDITPSAEFPRQASGVGIICGVVLYGALTARPTWTRRKRRPS